MKLTGGQTRRNGDSTPAGRTQPSEGGAGSAKGSDLMKMPPGKTWLWFMLALAVNYLLVRMLVPSPEAPVTVPYTLFKEEVGKSNVEAIYSQGDTITGRFTAPITYPPAGEKGSSDGGSSRPAGERGAGSRSPAPNIVSTFETILPAFVDPGLEKYLIENKVEISAKPIQEGGSLWATLLFSFGPALFFIGFYIWIFRRASQQGGGLMGGGADGHR